MTEQVKQAAEEQVQGTEVEVKDVNQPTEQPTQEAPVAAAPQQQPQQPQQQKPVVANTAKPQQQPQQQRAAAPVAQQPKQEESGRAALGQSALHVIATIEGYIDAMDPRKPQTPEGGAGQQRRLYRALKTTLEGLSPSEFQVVMRKVCNLFQKHKDGVFKDTNAGRFASHIPLEQAERNAFFSCLALLSAAADPSSRRRVVQQFDIHKGLRGGFSEDACQRLKEFLEG